MEDFNRILKETESLHSLDDKINHLLLRKRDAEIHIEKLKKDYHHTVFGWNLHSDLIALPEALQSEINRLLLLRSNNLTENVNSRNVTPVEKTSRDTLNASEASKYLGISKSAFYKLTSNNVIPYSKPGGKIIYVEKSDLEDYKQKNKIKSSAQIEEEANSFLQSRKAK